MSPTRRWYSISCTENHVHVSLSPARIVLSSAVVGGGLILARRIINLKVKKHAESVGTHFASPEQTISDYCRQQGWQGPMVGMMAAALSLTWFMIIGTDAK